MSQATAGSARCSSLENISVYYGNIAAVKGLTMNVPQGAIVTLIGSNGAGKSTTLRTISGLMQPRPGRSSSTARTSAAPRATRSWARGSRTAPRVGGSSRG